MNKSQNPILTGLTLFVTAFAVILVWVPTPLVSKVKFVVIPAIEKPIKIRPMNTSCMPFIREEVTYAGANSICEKKGDVWVNLNGLPCQTLATRKSDGSRLNKALEDFEEEVKLKVNRTVDGKRIFRRAPSMILLKSCNNDI
jgi:hypothetical protein